MSTDFQPLSPTSLNRITVSARLEDLNRAPFFALQMEMSLFQ